VFTPGASNKTEGSIMPNPKEDMDIPLLNYDLPGAINDVFSQLSVPPSGTAKQVFATVRGQGGGKSRVLEEIRRALLDIPTTLPIAITCNGLSKLTKIEKDWMSDDNLNTLTAYAMSTISRMIFSIYEAIDYETVVTKISNNLNTIPIISSGTMITEVISVFADDVFVVRGAVTDVVVFLDEPRLLGEHYNDSDIHEILRGAILNNRIGSLRCTLLMSSLEVSQVGYTKSGRGIFPLRLPEKLDEDEIVEKIFNSDELKISDDNRLKLKLIASLVSNLPRTVQFALNYIIENQSINPLNTAFIKNIFEYLLEKVSNRYEAFVPSDEMMFRLVYDMMVPLNDETKLMIEESILTNVVYQFTKTPPPFQPKASLPMLASAAQNNPNEVLAPFITRTFKEILDSIQLSEKEGDIMEDIFQIWTQFRLQCAYQRGCTDGAAFLTVAQLFGSSFLRKQGGIWNHQIIFPSVFDSLKIVSRMKRLSFIHPLNETSPGFEAYFKVWLAELIALGQVTKAKPISVIRLAEGDRGDYCVVIYRGEGINPYYVFLDMKSKRVKLVDLNDININPETEPKKSDGADNQSSKPLSEVDFGSQSEYILGNVRKYMNETEFAFIYFTSHNIEESISEIGAINLGTNSVKSFFSIIWPLYLAGRSTNTIEENAK